HSDVANVVAVYGDRACRHIKEPRYKLDQRAFARATRPHHCHDLPSAYLQIHVTQDGRRVAVVLAVRKAHIVEPHAVPERRQYGCAPLLLDFVFFVHEAEDFRRSAYCLLKAVVEERKLAHRIVEFKNRENEAQESTGAEGMAPTQ